MTMYKDGTTGKWYGTLPVILTRVIEARVIGVPGFDGIKGDTHQTESFIGYKSPYGSVSVSQLFESKTLTERPIEWWEAKGFTVTVDRAMDELREGKWMIDNEKEMEAMEADGITTGGL